MPTATTAQRRGARSIMWIALTLLLATIGTQLRVSVCVGDCCNVVVAPAPAGSCTCCGVTDTCDDESGDAPAEQPGDGMLRQSCKLGCCAMVAFEFELAPASAPVDTSNAAVMAGAAVQDWVAPDHRPRAHDRPFDRGPPRVDRRTALRADTVLLI